MHVILIYECNAVSKDIYPQEAIYLKGCFSGVHSFVGRWYSQTENEANEGTSLVQSDG